MPIIAHTKIFRIKFFTSVDMPQNQFEKIARRKAKAIEELANNDERIHCHVYDLNGSRVEADEEE